MNGMLNGPGRLALAGVMLGAAALLPAAGWAADKPAAHPAPVAAAPAAPAGPGAEAEAQIADLRKQLKITPAQETQFNAVAEVLRANAREQESFEREQSGQTGKQTAVDDLRAFQRFTELQAEGLKRLVPVFEALYGSLSEQQKQVADSTLGMSGPPPAPAPAQAPAPAPAGPPKKRG